MALLTQSIYAVHLLFAGLWAGAVVFTTWKVIPLAASGDVNAAPVEAVAGGLTTLSRTSAVVLLLTGGHMLATQVGVGGLLSTTRGYLVVAMVVLWVALAGLTEVGASKLTAELARDRVRTAAREATRFFQGASVVAVTLLLIGGALSTMA